MYLSNHKNAKSTSDDPFSYVDFRGNSLKKLIKFLSVEKNQYTVKRYTLLVNKFKDH